MRRFLKALVLLPVALIVVLISVANRGPVTVSFDPFSAGPPALGLELPLFVVFFAAVMIGVLIGGIAVWTTQGRHRRAARQNRRDLERLRSEMRRPQPQTQTPALPSAIRP
ncbi:lipopolysaccharide assembly protein LapA domain-containing protein [Chelatococcus sp. GCM10030263]|uniref:lipopolysaccharide assembly protein LapA domain-containing protein n=1 Tax=Chelatococcus sp. GCM10030263 TaxID=3273387 RepID=UPI00360BD6C0